MDGEQYWRLRALNAELSGRERELELRLQLTRREAEVQMGLLDLRAKMRAAMKDAGFESGKPYRFDDEHLTVTPIEGGRDA